MSGDFGQFIKSLDGHSTRVQALELVHNYVWSGSGSGTLIIHDAKVTTKKHETKYRTIILSLKRNYPESIQRKTLWQQLPLLTEICGVEAHKEQFLFILAVYVDFFSLLDSDYQMCWTISWSFRTSLSNYSIWVHCMELFNGQNYPGMGSTGSCSII